MQASNRMREALEYPPLRNQAIKSQQGQREELAAHTGVTGGGLHPPAFA